jgi:membrane fusion protein, multidrug efflux system
MVAYVPPTGAPHSSGVPSKPRRRGRGRLIAILILVILVALVVRRVMPSGAPMGGTMGTQHAAAVNVAPVVRRSVLEWHEFSGRLEAIEKAEVRARVSGIITHIYVQDGAVVTRGQNLLQLDPEPYRAELARAQGQLKSALAAAETASIAASRAQKLLKSQAIAPSEHDARIGEKRAADGALDAARAALETAKLNLSYTTIKAPISGRISRAELTTGNLVDNGSNAPILTTIVSQSPLYVSFEMDEQTFLSTLRAPSSATGTLQKRSTIPVEMGLANETGTPHKGRIASIDNQLDPNSGTMRVRAVFDNPNGALVPGLFARLRVSSGVAEEMLLVNEQAIATDQAGRFVFVVNDKNIAEPRPVTLGAMDGGLRVVTSGLHKGDIVIVSGTTLLRPNTPVTPTEVAMDTLSPINPPSADAPSSDSSTPAAP